MPAIVALPLARPDGAEETRNDPLFVAHAGLAGMSVASALCASGAIPIVAHAAAAVIAAKMRSPPPIHVFQFCQEALTLRMEKLLGKTFISQGPLSIHRYNRDSHADRQQSDCIAGLLSDRGGRITGLRRLRHIGTCRRYGRCLG